MMYTDVHRLLLQSFMCQPVMQGQDAAKKVAKLCKQIGAGDSCGDLKSIVDSINAKIKNHGLEIRRGTCEVTQKNFFVLIRTKQDTISKTMKYYTSSEQAFLRKILDEMFTSNEGFTTSIVCINFNNQVSKSFTKTEANAALKKLIHDNWLISKNGKIYIGIRTRIELEPYLKVEYADYLSSCDLCREITVIGHSCEYCTKSFHEHCIQKYFHTCKTDPICPSCKAAWSGITVSENFSFNSDDNVFDSANNGDFPSTSTGGSTQKTTTRRPNIQDFDFLGASSSGVTQVPSSRSSKRRMISSANGRGGGSDDDDNDL